MSGYTYSSTPREDLDRYLVSLPPFGNVGSHSPEDMDTDMSFNYSNYDSRVEHFAFPTQEDSYRSTELDSVSSGFQQILSSPGRDETEVGDSRDHNINTNLALNYPMGFSGYEIFASQSTYQPTSSIIYPNQQGGQVLRLTNPDPYSPPNRNYHSDHLSDPFVDEIHPSSSLKPLSNNPHTQYNLTPSGFHRRTHSDSSQGSTTSPSRRHCSPTLTSRHGPRDEQFVSCDALTTPPHSRQNSSDLSLSPTRRAPRRSDIGPLAAPGSSSLTPVTWCPWIQTENLDDPFVSSSRLGSEGSSSFLGRASPLFQVSDQCYFDSIGAIDVRFANAAKAQIFFNRYDASGLSFGRRLQHVPRLDRAVDNLEYLPEIDYRNTDHFYPIEPLLNPRQLETQERHQPADEFQNSSEVDRPGGTILGFDNGQPNRMPDLHSFFSAYPVSFSDPEDTDWATFIDSTYGPRLQRPMIFFHIPLNSCHYPNPKSSGLVFVRFWHQDERNMKLKTGVFTFERDWYRQTDTISFGRNPSCRIRIEPTKIVFAEKDSNIHYFEVPNVPWVWSLIEQLLLCACYLEFPYPSIHQILYVWATGARAHRRTIEDHVLFENFGDIGPYYAHHDPCDYHPLYIEPGLIALHIYPVPLATRLLLGHLTPPEGEYYTDENGGLQTAFERNLSFVQFMRQWFARYRLEPSRVLYDLPSPYDAVEFPPILEGAVDCGTWKRPAEIESHQVRTETFDVQGINWRSMGVTRRDARKLRDSLYIPYRNVSEYDPHGYGKSLPDTDHFFRFRRLQTKFKASLAHFQLRNLMSAVDKNCIAWVGEYRVNLTDPNTGRTNEVIRLVDSKDNTLAAAVRLSSMKAGYGVVVAGGFDGEYAMNGIGQPSSSQVTGILTDHKDAITNYVELYPHRHSSSPYAAFASNDSVMRIFDVQANTLVSTQPFSYAVNCSATSPDGRLRLVVGDHLAGHIVDAETGATLHQLRGHQDFGFACAWSPCGHQVATGNQDDTIMVFDTRMWRRLALITADVAGYRSLAFSPIGGGQRILVAAEPADRISIIDAQTYESRQVHDFFGEIGGIDFLPDGSNLVVANMDKKVGGLMWYERSSFGAERGLKHTKRLVLEFEGTEWRDEEPAEWVEGEEKALLKGVARGRRGLEMGDLVF